MPQTKNGAIGKMGKYKRRLSDAKLAKFLKAKAGNVTMAAKAAGYSRGRMCVRIKENPKLQQIVEDERDSMLDHAETIVKNALYEGDLKTAKWVLRCRGRDRGYATSQSSVEVRNSIVMGTMIRPDDEIADMDASVPVAPDEESNAP